MATMKDIIQSPLLPALFGSMALGLFASSSSGSKVVKGGIKGVLPVLIIMTYQQMAGTADLCSCNVYCILCICNYCWCFRN